MSPSIEQLDRFVRSARAGSYSAAAQELYVSPQTVSKSVHDMEHKLNIVLFEPTGRRLRPTARGAQVLHRASEVLEGVDDIRRICGDGGLSGAAGTSRLRVAVASSPLRGSVMAERDFRGFRRRCPAWKKYTFPTGPLRKPKLLRPPPRAAGKPAASPFSPLSVGRPRRALSSMKARSSAGQDYPARAYAPAGFFQWTASPQRISVPRYGAGFPASERAGIPPLPGTPA